MHRSKAWFRFYPGGLQKALAGWTVPKLRGEGFTFLPTCIILCYRRPPGVSGRLAAEQCSLSAHRETDTMRKRKQPVLAHMLLFCTKPKAWLHKPGSSLFLHLLVSFVDFKVPVKTSVRIELLVFDLFLTQPDHSSQTCIVWSHLQKCWKPHLIQ